MTPAPTPQSYTPARVDGVRAASRVAAEVLRVSADACVPGITTAELDQVARRAMSDRGAAPIFAGYQQGASAPFPGAISACVNDEVVHALPGARRVTPGDLVSIDVGVRVGEWCADVATSVLVPPVAPEVDTLVRITRETLREAAAMMKRGVMWSEVAALFECRAIEHDYAVVTDYIGHGIGRALHEPPDAPAHATSWSKPDFALEEHMTIAVEPIFVLPARSIESRSAPARDYKGFRRAMIKRLSDGWTVVTRDGSIACHEEHVIAVTPRGGEILTMC